MLSLHDQLIDPPAGTLPAPLASEVNRAAGVPVVGTRFRVPPPALAVYVIAITPLLVDAPELTVIPETPSVASGADQPDAKARPLAEFSATASFADDAKTKPSVTRARTV